MSTTGDGTNFSTETFMGLRTPTWGVCGPLGVEPPGLSWGEILGYDLGLLAQHTHAPGFGSQVPSAGLEINADVPWNGNNITSLRSTRYSAITLGSLGVSDLGCIIVSGVDLYYVDLNGNQIRMTSGGSIAGTPGSIAGLVPPAAATYTPASRLFSFTSAPTLAAGLSGGPFTLVDATVSNGKAATIQVPSGLAANYSLTLPTALPGSNALLSISTAGQLSAFGVVSGNLLTLSDTLTVTGSASAIGGNFTGGSGAGATGLRGTGGGTNGIGVDGQGTGNAWGVGGTGGPNGGPGGSFTGGGSSGIGVLGLGGGPNGHGVNGQAAGSGIGVRGFAGTTGDGGQFCGPGVAGVAGASRGLYAEAANNGVGGEFKGAGTGTGGKFTPGGSTTTAVESVGNISMMGSNPSSSTGFTNTLTALNVPKAWGTITTNGSGGVSVSSGFNIASVSVDSTDITVNLQTGLANSNYAIIATPNTANQIFVVARVISTSSLKLRVWTPGAGISDTTLVATSCGFVVFGIQ